MGKRAKKVGGAAKVGSAGSKPPKDADAVAVADESGVIRTYSLEAHGEGFRDLADEFASKDAKRRVIAAA